MIKSVNIPSAPVRVDGIGDFNAAINYTGGITLSAGQESALRLLQRTVLQTVGLYGDPLNLFSTSYDIVNGKAVFLNMFAAAFAIRANNGCVWDPQARVFVNSDGVVVKDLTLQFEQCYDELLGACLRRLLGKGNSIQDILATADGRALFEEAVAAVYISLINDLDVMKWLNNHQLIQLAYTNGASQMDDAEFMRFYAQSYGSSVPTGWLASLDSAAASGLPHLNGRIAPADVIGGYTGDAIALLNRTKAGATTRLRTAISRNAGLGVFFVSRSVFTRLQAQLGDNCCSDTILKAKLLGENPDIGWSNEHIMWQGHYVVPVDVFDLLDTATGTHSVRVIFTVRGNFGAAFDVSARNGQPDIAFEAEQRLGPGPGFMGKVYGQANFSVGFGIQDRDLVSYAKYESAA